MIEYPVDDLFSTICRGCMSDRKEYLQSIFNENVKNMYVLCTNLQVNESDGLPKFLCSTCVYKCVSSNSFREQCQRTVENIRNILGIKQQTEKIITLPKRECSVEMVNIGTQTIPGCFTETTTDINVSDQYTLNGGNEEPQKIDKIYESVEELSYDELIAYSDTAIDSSDDVDCGAWVTTNDAENTDEPEKEEVTVNFNGQYNIEHDGSVIKIVPVESVIDNKELIHPSTSRVLTTHHNCSMCSKTFNTTERYKAHQREHMGLKPYVCQQCDKEFNNCRALRRHQAKHTEDKRHHCEICGREYKYQTSLTLHRKSHQEARYICDLCGKSFHRTSNLQSHKLSHTVETPYECLECGKCFKNEIMLDNHRLRHNGVKKFKCGECLKTFVTSAELTIHIRVHTGDKPFKCDQCDKSYVTKSHLTVHCRSHTGERPYACDMCPLKFAYNKVLKLHRLTHTGERPYSCNMCAKRFRQQSTLKTHMMKHELPTDRHVPE